MDRTERFLKESREAAERQRRRKNFWNKVPTELKAFCNNACSKISARFLFLALAVFTTLGLYILGQHQAEAPAENDTLQNPDTSQPGIERLAFPPDDLTPLIPEAVLGKFYNTPFGWGNGPANWEDMTREERGQARFNGGFIRSEYDRGRVRIREMYYDPEHIKMRWQEELRGGEWVRHGPEFFWRNDGSGDMSFRLDGKVQGTRSWFDADGNVTSSEEYKNGMLILDAEAAAKPLIEAAKLEAVKHDLSEMKSPPMVGKTLYLNDMLSVKTFMEKDLEVQFEPSTLGLKAEKPGLEVDIWRLYDTEKVWTLQVIRDPLTAESVERCLKLTRRILLASGEDPDEVQSKIPSGVAAFQSYESGDIELEFSSGVHVRFSLWVQGEDYYKAGVTISPAR